MIILGKEFNITFDNPIVTVKIRQVISIRHQLILIYSSNSSKQNNISM